MSPRAWGSVTGRARGARRRLGRSSVRSGRRRTHEVSLARAWFPHTGQASSEVSAGREPPPGEIAFIHSCRQTAMPAAGGLNHPCRGGHATSVWVPGQHRARVRQDGWPDAGVCTGSATAMGLVKFRPGPECRSVAAFRYDRVVESVLDVDVPNIARMDDYFLGGSANFAVDRAAAEGFLRAGHAGLSGVNGALCPGESLVFAPCGDGGVGYSLLAPGWCPSIARVRIPRSPRPRRPRQRLWRGRRTPRAAARGVSGRREPGGPVLVRYLRSQSLWRSSASWAARSATDRSSRARSARSARHAVV